VKQSVFFSRNQAVHDCGQRFSVGAKFRQIRKIELKREYVATIFLLVKKQSPNFTPKNGKKFITSGL
jgi:hypothetical protein